MAADYWQQTPDQRNYLNLNATHFEFGQKKFGTIRSKNGWLQGYSTGLLQLVLDSYEIITMLMKNRNNATCYMLWIWPEKTWCQRKEIVRTTKVIQSVMDFCEFIMMLIKNLKNYESKNITQMLCLCKRFELCLNFGTYLELV